MTPLQIENAEFLISDVKPFMQANPELVYTNMYYKEDKACVVGHYWLMRYGVKFDDISPSNNIAVLENEFGVAVFNTKFSFGDFYYSKHGMNPSLENRFAMVQAVLDQQ